MSSGFLILNIFLFRVAMNIMCEMYINYYRLTSQKNREKQRKKMT